MSEKSEAGTGAAEPAKGDPLYMLYLGTGDMVDSDWIDFPFDDFGLFPGPLKNTSHPRIGTGFPPEMQAPLIVFGRRGRHVDFRAYGRSLWLISDRAKQFLETIDPEAFLFVKVNAKTKGARKADPLEPGREYWLCDLIRYVDALNIVEGEMDYSPNGTGGQFYMPILGKIGSFRKRDVGGAHVFRLASRPGSVMVDQFFADEAKRRKLTGLKISLRGAMS